MKQVGVSRERARMSVALESAVRVPYDSVVAEESVMTDWREHLKSDPAVCGGELCAAGTRVFVTNILDSLAEGATRDEILRSYPSLGPEHIDAAVAYARPTASAASRASV